MTKEQDKSSDIYQQQSKKWFLLGVEHFFLLILAQRDSVH